MDKRKLTGWFIVPILVIPWVLCKLDLITMHILIEGTVSKPKKVQFTKDSFTEFYNCLCNDRTVTCKTQFGGSYQHSTDPGPNVSSGEHSSFYKCTIPKSRDRMECNRLLQPTDSCDSATLSTAFTLTGHTTNCSSGCVGFVWKNSKERFSASHPVVDYSACQNQCYGITTTTQSTDGRKTKTSKTLLKNIATQKGFNTNESSSEASLSTASSQQINHAQQKDTNGRNDRKRHIITGLIAAILAILIIAVILCFACLRRPQTPVELEAENKAVPMNETDSIGDSPSKTSDVNDSSEGSNKTYTNVFETSQQSMDTREKLYY